jgi:dihydroflavonol-4-reductase
MAKAHVTVTGAAGHLGANLVRQLVDEGYDVRALVYRDRRPLADADAEQVRADVTDAASLHEAFRGTDVVIHLAVAIAVQGENESLLDPVNVQGTRNVVDACLETGVDRLVHCSSVHAFRQEPLDRPIDETRPLADEGPAHCYDRSKALGERVVMEGVEKGLDALILNPSAMLGPQDHKPSRMGETLLMIRGCRLPALVPGGYDWVDVRDVSRTTIQALDRGRKGERYILSGRWMSVEDLCRLACAVTGSRMPSVTVPLWMARLGTPFVTHWCRMRRQRPLYTSGALDTLTGNNRFDNRKAVAELGHEVRPLEETLRDAYAWYEAASMI